MPRKQILTLLDGGDRRMIGRSDQVAALVSKAPELFPELIAGLWSDDPVVRMRAADAAEKVSRKNREVLKPYRKELLGLMAEAEQQEVRWHLAAMVPRLTLNAKERDVAIASLHRYLEDRSSIVRTFALQGLADLAEDDCAIRPQVVELLREATRTGTPAMKARSRKLLLRLERCGEPDSPGVRTWMKEVKDPALSQNSRQGRGTPRTLIRVRGGAGTLLLVLVAGLLLAHPSLAGLLLAGLGGPATVHAQAGSAAPSAQRKTSTPYTGDLSIFDSPGRDERLQINRVMDMLGIEPGKNVADIGAGSGWFTVRAARRVTDSGTVYGVDINAEAIHYIDERAKKEQLANIKTILSKPDDPRLPADSIDAVLLLKTYHEVAHPVVLLRNLRSSLKTGARIGIIDRNGNGENHGVSKDVVIREAAQSGYELRDSQDFVKADGMDYFLIFTAKAN